MLAYFYDIRKDFLQSKTYNYLMYIRPGECKGMSSAYHQCGLSWFPASACGRLAITHQKLVFFFWVFRYPSQCKTTICRHCALESTSVGVTVVVLFLFNIHGKQLPASSQSKMNNSSNLIFNTCHLNYQSTANDFFNLIFNVLNF